MSRKFDPFVQRVVFERSYFTSGICKVFIDLGFGQFFEYVSHM